MPCRRVLVHPRIRGLGGFAVASQIHRMQATLMKTDDSDLIADVLSFWLGQPADDAEALNAKFMRWYQGGETVDAQIRQRYASLIDRALSGELLHWRSSKSGRLALIVMLDQFTRNIYRGTPRAYAGDARALELALEMLRDGSYEACSQEEPGRAADAVRSGAIAVVVGARLRTREALSLRHRALRAVSAQKRDLGQSLYSGGAHVPDRRVLRSEKRALRGAIIMLLGARGTERGFEVGPEWVAASRRTDYARRSPVSRWLLRMSHNVAETRNTAELRCA